MDSSVLAPVLTGCHVCRGPMVETINGWMKSGLPDTEIERRLKEAGTPISRITLGKHKRKHLRTPFDRQRKEAADSMRRQQGTLRTSTKDLATLIRDNVVGRVETGELEPTIAEGLRAQQLLDTRAEKGADRDVMLQIAQVLGGAIAYPQVVEGSFREVDEEADADFAELRLLGSGA